MARPFRVGALHRVRLHHAGTLCTALHSPAHRWRALLGQGSRLGFIMTPPAQRSHPMLLTFRRDRLLRALRLRLSTACCRHVSSSQAAAGSCGPAVAVRIAHVLLGRSVVKELSCCCCMPVARGLDACCNVKPVIAQARARTSSCGTSAIRTWCLTACALDVVRHLLGLDLLGMCLILLGSN